METKQYNTYRRETKGTASSRWIFAKYWMIPQTNHHRLCELIIYTLVMTNSLPWKDPPFLRTVNPGKPSISIRAIEKPWRTVSHNQRVNLLITGWIDVSNLRDMTRPGKHTKNY